jgi:zinc/manganese transport system substrate-binding protein
MARHGQGREGGPAAALPARAVLVLAAVTVLAAGCAARSVAGVSGPGRRILAVGAESQYASVIRQIGGRYVAVTAVMSNPNTDPHSFEASASVSQSVGAARLVVQNGLGYDSFMNTIESATPNASRQVIDVQQLLRRPDSTPNPHLWYAPATMPAVAAAVAARLAALQPAHAGYFRARLAAFRASLRPWLAALARLRARYPAAPVAVTEPVGDYLLQAAGADIRTPFGLQADIMNGVDLPAQYVTLQQHLLAAHEVAALLYNRQVESTVTQGFLAAARQARVPVVGVYETMPAGYTYQSWMLAETRALRRALASRISTERL